MPRARARKATVGVERNGAFIRIDDVPVAEAGTVLADILEAFRVLEHSHQELIRDLDGIGGGPPTDVIEDDYEQGRARRRLGFR